MKLTPHQKRLLQALAEDGLRGEGMAFPFSHEQSFPFINEEKKAKPVSGVDDTGKLRFSRKDGEALVALGLVEWVNNGPLHWKLTPTGIRVAVALVPNYTPLDLHALFTRAFNLEYFHPQEDGKTPIPYFWDKGDANARLVLVLGENAGGKSFFRRLIREMTFWGRKASFDRPERKPGPFPVREFMGISMEGRTADGGGGLKPFIYGTEDWQSTGENSASTITVGIRTTQGRTYPTIMCWDEPDLGMSAGSAAGAGVAINKMLVDLSPLVQAVMITSHSLPFVRNLVAGLPSKPHYIYLGDASGPPTLADWMTYQINPTPVDPEVLKASSLERFRMISALMSRRSK